MRLSGRFDFDTSAGLDSAPSAARPLADRGDDVSYAVEWHEPTRLSRAERARWTRLGERSGGANVFALEWFMVPAIAASTRDGEIRLAVVRRADGEWLGALPLRLERSIGRCPVPCLTAWSATNQFIGTPLVLPGGEKAFWQALLGALDSQPGLALALCCEDMPAEDPATLALASACTDENRTLTVLRRFERAARLPRKNALYPAPALRKARARLASLERRLARDHGPVRVEALSAPASCKDWIERFLTLERAGWKGEAGSALACAASTTELFREAIERGHALGHARLASLHAGEQVVAMTSWFEIEGRGYGFKMAHDERFRTYAPGRLLMRAVAEDLAGDPALAFDTCNPAGANPDPFWPDARSIIDCAVAIGGGARRGLLDAALGGAARWRALARKRSAPIARR